MSASVSAAALSVIRKMQQNELTESVIYAKIAQFAKGEENKKSTYAPLKQRNCPGIVPGAWCLLSSFLRAVRSKPEDARRRGRPSGPWCQRRCDRSYGTPKP